MSEKTLTVGNCTDEQWSAVIKLMAMIIHRDRGRRRVLREWTDPNPPPFIPVTPERIRHTSTALWTDPRGPFAQPRRKKMESVDYWVTDDGVVHFDVRCRICGCRNKYGSVEDLEKGWTCGSCVDCPPWSYVRALEDAIIGVLQDGDLNHLQAHNPVKGREK